jgi:hypothetical protein
MAFKNIYKKSAFSVCGKGNKKLIHQMGCNVIIQGVYVDQIDSSAPCELQLSFFKQFVDFA